MAHLGIKDRRTLDNARNKLAQANLIKCDKKATNPNVTYTITSTFNAEADVQVNAQVNVQADVQVSAQADDTKDKLNKTKLKNNTPSIPQRGKRESKNKKFSTPGIEEVEAYCLERKNGISGESFVSFYESKGWMVGKNKMKDWKAAVRTWEQKRKEEINAGNKKSVQSFAGGKSSQNKRESLDSFTDLARGVLEKYSPKDI